VFLGYKTDTTVPATRGIIEHIVESEPFGVRLSQTVELISKQYIFMIDISINQIHPGPVLRIFEYDTQDLIHGSDASATGNHAQTASEVVIVNKLPLGSFNTQLVAYFELANVSRDISFLIGLNEKVKVATIFMVADGGIATRNDLAIYFSRDGYVLTSREIQDIVCMG